MTWCWLLYRERATLLRNATATLLGPIWFPSLALRSPPEPQSQSTRYMGFLHTLLDQPSRSYSLPDPDRAAPAAKEGEQDERAARKAQYYSAAADPNLRREWERILQNGRARAHATPPLRLSPRSVPISPLRHQAFAVCSSHYSSCRAAYRHLISGAALPCSRN